MTAPHRTPRLSRPTLLRAAAAGAALTAAPLGALADDSSAGEELLPDVVGQRQVRRAERRAGRGGRRRPDIIPD
jgi:hypothetical protein